MLANEQIEKPPHGDPSHCKGCPNWHEGLGLCVIPVEQRADLCGSRAERFEPRAESSETDFELYRRPEPVQRKGGFPWKVS